MIDRAIGIGIVDAIEHQKNALFGDKASLFVSMAILGMDVVPENHKLPQELHRFLTEHFRKLGWYVSESIGVNEENQHVILSLHKINVADLYF
ncbi:MAG: hypothetical protein HZA34_03885 [Candidatus Pacebacteria bacterium]|nr:hypothetical protein [Candidatus Paceibacterota bacterium]